VPQLPRKSSLEQLRYLPKAKRLPRAGKNASLKQLFKQAAHDVIEQNRAMRSPRPGGAAAAAAARR
jgi:hypothetical protein